MWSFPFVPPRQGEWLYARLAPGSKASDPISAFKSASRSICTIYVHPNLVVFYDEVAVTYCGNFTRNHSHQWLDNFAAVFCTHHSNKSSLFANGPKLGTLTCVRVCTLSHRHQSEPLTWNMSGKKVLLSIMCPPAQQTRGGPSTGNVNSLLKPVGWWKFTLLRSWPLVASHMCSRRGP